MSHHISDALLGIVGPRGLLCGADVHARSAGALRTDTLVSDLLVRPACTAEVAAVLKLCNQHGVRVVPQGGRTGLVHGADASREDLILSLERMNAIEEIDPVQRVAIAQAGVTLQALQEAVQAQDLAFPLDLGARGTATLGGNVATNAGGNRVIRYGMMRDMVLGLEVVLADGTVLDSLNRMIKNNAGYDLKQLFIGSEGTLGVVTRVALRLRERSTTQNVALAALDDFGQLTRFLRHADRALGGGLSAFEVMWRDFYQLVTTPPAAASPPLSGQHAYYALVESLGYDATQDAARFTDMFESALEGGLVADAAIASSERECAQLWAMRDDVLQVARDGMPFTFDVSLPLMQMEAYIEEARSALAAYDEHHACWIFGHLGDGNLHLAVRSVKADARAAVERIVYEPLRRRGGSISAEHGIGLEKKAYLSASRSDAEIALMRQLKAVLDPHGVLNAGNIF